MGSEKYPGDNVLDVLTNRHGGYDNAFTDYERVGALLFNSLVANVVSFICLHGNSKTGVVAGL